MLIISFLIFGYTSLAFLATGEVRWFWRSSLVCTRKFKIAIKLPQLFKTSSKVYEVMFLICKSMYILSISYVYIYIYIYIYVTIQWNKTKILRKFPSGKINDTKNVLLFLLRAANHHSFTFFAFYLSPQIWAEAQGLSL